MSGGILLCDSWALVWNGWNGWLTRLITFIWVVGAVRLAITEPSLGDAGFLVVTEKLPYVTHDGFWVAWKKHREKETEKMQHEWMVLSRWVTCFGRKHVLVVNLNMSVEWSRGSCYSWTFFKTTCSKWICWIEKLSSMKVNETEIKTFFFQDAAALNYMYIFKGKQSRDYSMSLCQ